jgi:hypothetical protein
MPWATRRANRSWNGFFNDGIGKVGWNFCFDELDYLTTLTKLFKREQAF